MHKHFRPGVLTLAALLALVLALPAKAYEALTGPTGVLKYVEDKTQDGYILFAPNRSTTTYLINNEGQIVHQWESKFKPGRHAELLPNGHLLRPISKGPFELVTGALSGCLQELDWDGNVVWEYNMKTKDVVSHHGFDRMPNGNTLLLGFERVSQEALMKLGREKGFKPFKKAKIEHKDFWVDFIREVDAKGKTVWEWHATDHLGKGKDKLDVNYILPKGIGRDYYTFDWSHFNQVEYLPETDQLLVNSRNLSESFLVDHKTGKITYRWGNDSTWNPDVQKPGFGDDGEQILFGPHCTTQIENGNWLVFDNGSERPSLQRSRVVEVDPKTGKIVWEYESMIANSFASQRQGSVQRLPNGNTFVCSANHGHIFEVTPDKKVVWEFVNPVAGGKVKAVISDEVDGTHVAHGLTTNAVHRAYKYAPDYPAFKGRDLSPKGYIGGDLPVFYKAWKMGASLVGGKAVDDDADEGPAMHAY